LSAPFSYEKFSRTPEGTDAPELGERGEDDPSGSVELGGGDLDYRGIGSGSWRPAVEQFSREPRTCTQNSNATVSLVCRSTLCNPQSAYGWLMVSATRSAPPRRQALTSTRAIQARILILRDQQVLLDEDLAELYGVETKL
jgi:hypothetical protein